MELTKNEHKQRLMMMIFGAAAIFFTGYTHIWSIYQPYMMVMTGWSSGQTSMGFYLAMLFFVFGNIAGGRIQDRYNPRIAIMVGGGIFASGVLLMVFAITESPIWMYLTYGVMQGFGQGMIYSTTLSIAQKWFPERTGFASGVIVTANGLCGLFLAPLSRFLLGVSGPKLAFIVIGSMIALSWILGSIFIIPPLREMSIEKTDFVHQYKPAEMMKTKKFYYLVLTMLCGLFAYFLISPMAQGIQVERGVPIGIAIAAVMGGSVANAATRLVLPSAADKIGRIACIKAVLLVLIGATLLLTVNVAFATSVSIILIYGCYGGIMGSFPSLTSTIFGMKHSGENYGLVMSSIVIVSISAPAIHSFVNKSGYGLDLIFEAGIFFAALSLVFAMFLNRECKKTEKGETNHGVSDHEKIAGKSTK